MTLVAFGLTLRPELPIRWHDGLTYAPEKDPGRCGKESDVCSLAKLLSQVFCVRKESLREWITMGRDMDASDRGSLGRLARALAEGREDEDGWFAGGRKDRTAGQGRQEGRRAPPQGQLRGRKTD